MRILDKFMKLAIKIIFKNKVVQSLSKGPLKACEAAMAVLMKNPVLTAQQGCEELPQISLTHHNSGRENVLDSDDHPQDE